MARSFARLVLVAAATGALLPSAPSHAECYPASDPVLCHDRCISTIWLCVPPE